MPSPRYILSERAASALRELIAPGSAYGSRPRPIRDVGGGDNRRPLFLECRIFPKGATDPGTGEPVDALRVFVGPSGNYPTSIRINGRAALLSYTAGDLDAEGWLQLGDASTIAAVWLVPTELPGAQPKTYAEATNWGNAVGYSFDTTGNMANPGAAPSGAPGNNWPRWMHPLCLCGIVNGKVLQGIIGGADVSVEVGDADGTHSGSTTPGPGVAGGFCSIEQNDQKQLQLHGFNAPNLVDPTVAMVEAAGIDLVIRQAVYQGQQSQSLQMGRVRYMALYELIDVLRMITGDDWWSTFQNQLPAIMGVMGNYADANQGPFWRSGGDASTCYGEDIADATGTVVIDLDGKELQGDWIAKPANNGRFQVDGRLDVTAGVDVANDVTAQGFGNFGQLDVNSDAVVGGDLAVTGDISGTQITGSKVSSNDSVDAATDVTAGGNVTATGDVSAGGDVAAGGDVSATGELSGGSLKVNGTTYTQQTITYLDANGQPQTLDVLAT